ncbi:MAG: DUF1080 domain-containing protein [Chthoniobacteraceae bacterium]
MKSLLAIASLALLAISAQAGPVSLFDGKTLAGWEGDTAKTWRVEDGCIAGGSLTEKVPRNEFLSAKKSYKNFDLTLKFKLTGTEGFVNSGVQFRSVRIEKPANEMSGYQADLGDPTYWGSLYDESRRRKTLAPADMEVVNKVLHRNDWNDYRVRCEGKRIRIWLNGVQTVDYTEPESGIAEDGLIALQIHGGAKAVVFFKDIAIEELP